MSLLSDTRWHSPGGGRFEARLEGGRFRFEMSREDLPFRDLCEVALRDNPRRRFLFVSKVLGRHWPVRPAHLRQVARLLAEKLWARLGAEPAVFIGMAETATTLGQAVFRECLAQGCQGIYLESTRRCTGGEMAFTFSEVHSHATAHHLHLPGPGEDPQDWFRQARQLVIVDDEVTTGQTAANLADRFREWRGGGPPLDATLAVLLHWRKGREAPPSALGGIESVVEGSFEFTDEPGLAAVSAAAGSPLASPPVRRGVRHGTALPETLPSRWQVTASPGERILVLGGGEYGFQPLLLAEKLEAEGASVWIQATTRSPIRVGGAIRHARSFPALCGGGHRENLYNVPSDHPYDRILLCLEDPAPSPGHPIYEVPKLEVLT